MNKRLKEGCQEKTSSLITIMQHVFQEKGSRISKEDLSFLIKLRSSLSEPLRQISGLCLLCIARNNEKIKKELLGLKQIQVNSYQILLNSANHKINLSKTKLRTSNSEQDRIYDEQIVYYRDVSRDDDSKTYHRPIPACVLRVADIWELLLSRKMNSVPDPEYSFIWMNITDEKLPSINSLDSDSYNDSKLSILSYDLDNNDNDLIYKQAKDLFEEPIQDKTARMSIFQAQEKAKLEKIKRAQIKLELTNNKMLGDNSKQNQKRGSVYVSSNRSSKNTLNISQSKISNRRQSSFVKSEREKGIYDFLMKDSLQTEFTGRSSSGSIADNSNSSARNNYRAVLRSSNIEAGNSTSLLNHTKSRFSRIQNPPKSEKAQSDEDASIIFC